MYTSETWKFLGLPRIVLSSILHATLIALLFEIGNSYGESCSFSHTFGQKMLYVSIVQKKPYYRAFIFLL